MARRSLALAVGVLLGLVMLVGRAPADATPRWQTLPPVPAMPTPAATGVVDVAGAKIYFARFGQGPPLILLHGGLGNGDHFAHQVPVLAARFSVIAIDSRGHGRSTLGKQPLSYHRMAEDVVAVMDHLQLPRAIVVGWSDGGAIALDLAIRQPARVAKLFVFGTNAHASGLLRRKGPASPTFLKYAARCKADHRRLSRTPKAYDRLVARMRPVWRDRGGFTDADLRTIQAPTVIAAGAHDEILRRDHLEAMAAAIPGAKLVIFKDTSHFALWQDVAAFNRALLEFLAP